VKMASAKKFGQNLLECGVNATMSKHDLVAAYKQVPCMIKDLRLQGFSWLGRFFVRPGKFLVLRLVSVTTTSWVKPSSYWHLFNVTLPPISFYGKWMMCQWWAVKGQATANSFLRLTRPCAWS